MKTTECEGTPLRKGGRKTRAVGSGVFFIVLTFIYNLLNYLIDIRNS